MGISRIRRTVGCFVATALACSALGALPAVAMADEGGPSIVPMHNNDCKFHFDFTFLQETAGDSIELKHNASSTYVRLDSVNIDAAQLYVDGAVPNSTNLVNCMGGADAVVNRGLKGQFCIRNLVYERFGQSGVANSQLTGWGMKNTGTIDGVWSPDSLYNYTPLNGYCNPNIW